LFLSDVELVSITVMLFPEASDYCLNSMILANRSNAYIMEVGFDAQGVEVEEYTQAQLLSLTL
jgi:hypothetical protein